MMNRKELGVFLKFYAKSVIESITMFDVFIDAIKGLNQNRYKEVVSIERGNLNNIIDVYYLTERDLNKGWRFTTLKSDGTILNEVTRANMKYN